VLNIHVTKGISTQANICIKMSHKVQYNVALKTNNPIEMKKNNSFSTEQLRSMFRTFTKSVTENGKIGSAASTIVMQLRYELYVYM
jgi:uncharacterized protein YllA (UPF0747 family)